MNREFTTREKVLLLILAVFLLCIAYLKLFLEPLNDSIEVYQEYTAAEQDELMINEAELKQMKVMQKELEKIHTSDSSKPLPNYDNSETLLKDLKQILASSSDYSLDFGETTTLEGDYIVCRPLNLEFTASSYAKARSILNALHDSSDINQISDLTIDFGDSKNSSVDVSLIITFYELKE